VTAADTFAVWATQWWVTAGAALLAAIAVACFAVALLCADNEDEHSTPHPDIDTRLNRIEQDGVRS
jgi:hypothetical protein